MAKELLTLIDDILDLSKIEASELRLNPQEICFEEAGFKIYSILLHLQAQDKRY